MKGGTSVAAVMSSLRKLDIDGTQGIAGQNPADDPKATNLLKPNQKGDFDVMQGKTLVQNIHEQLVETRANGANYCNLLWFILYVILYVAILGMQRSPPEAFMVEEAIKNALFSESTSTVEYSTGEISTTMDSAEHIYRWFRSNVVEKVFLDPVCGDGVCDQPLEYRQWHTYGCSDDCGTYPSSLTTTIVVNITADFEDADEVDAGSWNLCSSTHDVCYFDSNQVFASLNESQTYEVSLLDGVWEVQLTALRGGIIGQVYIETSEIVTVAEIVNGTSSASDNETGVSNETYVEYYTYVNISRQILAEWDACKDSAGTVPQSKIESIRTSCEAATGEVKRVCSVSDCGACTETKCAQTEGCAFDDVAQECYVLSCGNDPEACPYCSSAADCNANADCVWDSSDGCIARCSEDDCGSEACLASQKACEGHTGSKCIWDVDSEPICRLPTSQELCAQDCAVCGASDCLANEACAYDAAEGCMALCSADDCASEACLVSETMCEGHTSGECTWDASGDPQCRLTTDADRCELDCSYCTVALCKSNENCYHVASAGCVGMCFADDCASTACVASQSACEDHTEGDCIWDSSGASRCRVTTEQDWCARDCTRCATSALCNDNTDCTYDATSGCVGTCYADECSSDACVASQSACEGHTEGACVWDTSGNPQCREPTAKELCAQDCASCSTALCKKSDSCVFAFGVCTSAAGVSVLASQIQQATASQSCSMTCSTCRTAATCQSSDAGCEWDGRACTSAAASADACGLYFDHLICKAQPGCSWSTDLGICFQHTPGRRMQSSDTCASMSSCEACSNDAAMCEKKSGCTFNYQDWACTGVQEVTEACDDASGGLCTTALLHNGFCDDECNIPACGYDGGACADTAGQLGYICSDMCYCSMLADNVCNSACDTASCGFDLGDCCERVFTTSHSVSFELWNHFTAETIARLTPDPLVPRKRYLATANRLIGGVLLLQHRHERGACASDRFAVLGNECFTGSASTLPFGADPVFLRNSSLNTDSSVYKSKNLYYNLSDPTQVSAQGMPYGFRHYSSTDNSSETSIEGFPVYLDVNLGLERALEILAYMQEGFYIDSDTDSLDVMMVTYNPHVRMFANTKASFTFEQGGRVSMSYTVQTFRVESYATARDLSRARLEVIFLLLTLLNLGSEFRDFLRDFWRTGRPLTYFRSMWNYVDMVNILLLTWNVIGWIRFYREWANGYSPQERYNVYLDLDARANFLASNATGMDGMLRFVVLSGQMSEKMGMYTALNGVALILMVFRVLKVLDFQKRMGLVTRTISNAATDLAHFAILFSVIFSLYACLAYIIFGSSIIGFSTLARAFNTCFSMLLGDIGVIDELLMHPSLGAAVAFYYSFIFLAYFILMNILLAILVEAFVEVKRSAAYSKSLPAEIVQILRTRIRSLPMFRTDNHMSDQEIIELFSDWVMDSKIIDEKDKIGRRTYSADGFSANKEQLEAILESELKRVRNLARESNIEEVASVLGHKATSPLNAILQSESQSINKLAASIAHNILHRYGLGTDVVKARSRIIPADLEVHRRANEAIGGLRRRTSIIANAVLSPKRQRYRSPRRSSMGIQEEAMLDEVPGIEERISEED